MEQIFYRVKDYGKEKADILTETEKKKGKKEKKETQNVKKTNERANISYLLCTFEAPCHCFVTVLQGTLPVRVIQVALRTVTVQHGW